MKYTIAKKAQQNLSLLSIALSCGPRKIFVAHAAATTFSIATISFSN
jgi:hypothetical protein